MVKQSKYRKEKYEKGVDPEVIRAKFAAQKDSMVEQETKYLGTIEGVEKMVKELVEAEGVPTIQVAQYINFGREMWSLSNKFGGATAQRKAQSLVDKWVGRGLVGSLLITIAQLFGITPEAPDVTLESIYELIEVTIEEKLDNLLNVLGQIMSMTGSTFDRDTDSLEATGHYTHHVAQVFPEDTDQTVTFTAGGVANTWGDWTEILDNEANKFSDEVTDPTHISAFLIEAASEDDVVYLFEVAYGDAKTTIARYRFISGVTLKLPAIQQIRIRGYHFPPGELIYYRMKCETGGATLELHIRHYKID